MSRSMQTELPETGVSERPARHLPFLDGVRGFAALWVMIGHAKSEAITITPEPSNFVRSLAFINEGLGVPIFIVLSGFLLFIPIVVQSRWNGPLAFLDKRFRRIYPNYLVILFTCTILSRLPLWSIYATERWKVALPSSLPAIGLHIFQLQNVLQHYSRKIDPPMWTLGCEMQFYIAFAFVLVPVFLKKGISPCLAAGSLGSLLYVVIAREQSVLAFCFLFGCLAAWVVFNPTNSFVRFRKPTPLLLLAAVLAIATLKFAERQPTLCLASAGLSAALLLIALVDTSTQSPVAKLLHAIFGSKIGIVLGWFSYSLYLVHYPILSGIGAFCTLHGFSSDARAGILLTVGPGLSIAMAALFAWLFEYRFLKRRSKAIQLA